MYVVNKINSFENFTYEAYYLVIFLERLNIFDNPIIKYIYLFVLYHCKGRTCGLVYKAIIRMILYTLSLV